MSEEVFVVGLLASLPATYGVCYFLVWLMGRTHDRGDLIREARLEADGYQVIERRELFDHKAQKVVMLDEFQPELHVK